MLHISWSVSSIWKHLWCFHRSSWSLSKVIVEKQLVTFDGLKWPCRHDEGWSQYSDSGCQVYIHATRCMRVFFMVWYIVKRSCEEHYRNSSFMKIIWIFLEKKKKQWRAEIILRVKFRPQEFVKSTNQWEQNSNCHTMAVEITWNRKVNFEIWPQVKAMTWLEKVILHISQFGWTRQTHCRLVWKP